MNEMGIKTNILFQEITLSPNTWLDIYPYNKIIENISREYKLKIIFSSSFANLGFSVVVCNHKNQASEEFSLIGSGSSFDHRLSIKRALGEASQTITLRGEEGIRREMSLAQELGKKKRLASLIGLSNGQHVRLGCEAIRSTGIKSITTDGIVDKISCRMSQLGHKVFYRHLTPPTNNLHVISTFIPGLDRFHLIRSGNLVAPQSWLRTSK